MNIQRALSLTAIFLLTQSVPAAPAGDDANRLFIFSESGNARPVVEVVGHKYSRLSLWRETNGGKWVGSGVVKKGQALYLYSAGAVHGSAVVQNPQVELEDCGTEEIAAEKGTGMGMPGVLASTKPIVIGKPRITYQENENGKRVHEALLNGFFKWKGSQLKSSDALPQYAVHYWIDVGATELPILVSSGVIPGLGSQDHETYYFFIASAKSGYKYQIEYAEYSHQEATEGSPPMRTYANHLDLDEDGVDEIIYSFSGYEWWGYGILKLLNGKWAPIHEQTVGGC